MSYQETIGYLYGLQQHGMKFGLDNIRALLSALGNPHTAFRSVHIAGTNGKGSTSAMIASILRTGADTGLFTSPHLVSFTERIRINGAEISEGEVVRLADAVRAAAGGIPDLSPTFFEVVTAMAFLCFRERGVDWAVIETGLGGRLDSTNAITPELTVITPIGLDHREYLGATLSEIAREKAGIIKPGVPVVSAAQHEDAMTVIRSRAREADAPLSVCSSDFSFEIIDDGLDGAVIDYAGDATLHGLRVPLAGSHQAANAALAIRAAEGIRRTGSILDIAEGIRSTTWPGRLEMVSQSPPILIDGAHNPQAAASLARYLQRLLAERYSRIILVLGIMKDKDMEGIIAPLLPLAEVVIVTAPSYGRAAAPEQLAALAAGLGKKAIAAPTVADALSTADRLRSRGDVVVVTGSFYTIGEAKELLGTKGVLSRLRE